MKITSKPRLQSRLNSLATLLLIVCLTILLAWLSVRYQTQMDWTQSGRHTLSHASQEVLDRMQGPVEITAYAREDAALRKAVEKIVGRYQRLKTDIHLKFINPDAVPDEVRNAGVSVNGEMLLRYQGRTEHVKTGTEEEFTMPCNALRGVPSIGWRFLRDMANEIPMVLPGMISNCGHHNSPCEASRSSP